MCGKSDDELLEHPEGGAVFHFGHVTEPQLRPRILKTQHEFRITGKTVKAAEYAY